MRNRPVFFAAVLVVGVSTFSSPSGASVYSGEQDIQIDLTTYPYVNGCEYADQLASDATCLGVHAAAAELVSTAYGVHGDVYAVAYTSIVGHDQYGNVVRQLSYRWFDTNLGLSSLQHWEANVAASVNAVGHTSSCLDPRGNSWTKGCGWLAGYSIYRGTPQVYLMQVRSLGFPGGPAWLWHQSIAQGYNPAGDTGAVCTKKWVVGCLAYSWKLLLVYASPDRAHLMGLFVGLDAQPIGSEFVIADGIGIDRPQVAWDPLQRRWLVAYEDWAGHAGGYLHTTAVDWSGAATAANHIDACEPVCLAKEMLRIGSGHCHGMWLAAPSHAEAGDQLLLHNYCDDYLLDPSGAKIATDSTSSQYNVVAATSAIDPYSGARYLFQRLEQGRQFGQHRRYAADWYWGDGRTSGDVVPFSSIPGSAYGQALRKGWLSAAGLYVINGKLYLTLINN